MSIPPLVCSTPPPPDQCEEDKDHEDFDIPYNLSQDDDDEDNYNFGRVSSYNNIESGTGDKNDSGSVKSIEILSSSKVQPPIHETFEHYSKEHHSGPHITSPNKITCEEDPNIEDLELEINEESIEISMKVENQVVKSSESSISEVNNSNEVSEDHLRTLSPSPATEDNSDELLSLEDKKSCENVVESPNFETNVFPEPDTNYDTEAKQISISFRETETEHRDQINNLHDDFNDFDDFQFASSDNRPLPIIDSCNNPWESNETENDSFGSFTANFDAVEETIPESVPTEITQTPLNNDEFQNDDDDDFGDFDDFKSSKIHNAQCMDESLSQQGPGINFQLSDNESQVTESITDVIGTIFEEEVKEPTTDFDGKLETMLSETWRHLRETDVRQPYIVNWNNSLGQKTLLRALCIDSRNILFGPKWSYNMPKYAVNLSNAPLQPQKSLTPSSSSQSENALDKSAVKPGGWVDPFTSDGQESCNTENESVVEVTSSDLDVFEAAISTKQDKIYSSALNVQPLRQINLPDTHIFTPTDSETPRSKTIHYDIGPVLLSQTTLDNTKTAENIPIQNTEISNDITDDDDWEFQDFKGSSTSTPPTRELEVKCDNTTKSTVSYQTQVLQPIKMEPLMPSLNWPDPGQVKETFEDFSDFVSKTSWNIEQSHITSPVKDAVTTEVSGIDKEVRDNVLPLQTSQVESNSFGDEFDTFQSALPRNLMGDLASLNSNTFNNNSNQGTSQSPSIINDFDYTFPKLNSDHSDSISVDNTTGPNKALTQSLGSIPKPELTLNKNLLPLRNPMSSNLLEPVTVSTLVPHKNQKTTQILQPLSLESYSQINWPNPGIDLQDLSRFNPVETLQSLKSELSAGGTSKGASPVHAQKNTVVNQASDDDIWGEFVSSKPKQTLPKKPPVFADDDEWTEFVSSPSVKPQNGLNTISLNVHTNSNIQKASNLNKIVTKNSKAPLDVPTLNYITPKSSGHNAYRERHFQNL